MSIHGQIRRLAQMFQEPDGKWSFGRISSGIVLAAWITWVSICVCATHTLPERMWEISTLVGTLYGLNKITTAVTPATTDSTTVVTTQSSESHV